MKPMKATTRRIVQALLYEAIAVIAVTPAIAWIFAHPLGSSLLLTLLMSSIALAWNYGFNTLYERWEARQAVKGRTFTRRLAHGVLFEVGLATILIPFMAYWLNISLLHALLADMGVLAFFFVYTVVFTWVFDRIFGLPVSAQQA